MRNLFMLFFVSLLLTLTGCGWQANTQSYWVDNPTDQEITVKIDEIEHQIPANGGKSVDLSYGTHNLSYNNESIKFMVVPCDQPVVINPTLSNYFLFTKYYLGDDTEKAEKEVELLLKSSLKLIPLASGDTLEAPFQVFNPLFIEGYDYHWKFGVGEKLPEVLTVKTVRNQATYTGAHSARKLFREKEFRAFTQISDSIQFRREETKLSDLKPVALFDEMEECDCPAWQKYVEELKLKYDSLLLSTDKKEIEWFRVELGGGPSVDIQKECSPRYNDGLESNFDGAMVSFIDKARKALRGNMFIIE